MLDGLGLAANLAGALACAWAANHLYGLALGYYAAGGGSEFIGFLRRVNGIEPAKAILPGLHLRAMWFGMAWACAVFACGFACLALAGGRSLYWRTLALLRSA